MDSITHLALGACIGEILLAPKIGKKALLWGALAQSFPDIDFIASFFLTPDAALMAHRGLSHSIFFAFVAGILLACALKWEYKKNNSVSLSYLAFFIILQILIHDLLDISNAYGTGLFEPFIHTRFSINLLYVADPLFSISLIIAALVLVFRSANNTGRKKWAVAGLCLSMLYLFISGINKWIVEEKIKTHFAFDNTARHPFILTPTPFNNILWYLIAKKGDMYYTAYVSVFDKADRNLDLTGFERNDSLLGKAGNNNVLSNLLLYANGYYTAEQRNDTVVFNVLRFGQVQGWKDPHAPFVFHYFLNEGSNTLVVQRSRFQGWSASNIKLMLRRMSGKSLRDSIDKINN